ncbi:hypothetical protein AC792_12875 [Arthrobacter sp. RIT-PI-e]|nr:hypothetical protein AC792_12875 [Arthrobacter sp. RIT-PI-e]
MVLSLLQYDFDHPTSIGSMLSNGIPHHLPGPGVDAARRMGSALIHSSNHLLTHLHAGGAADVPPPSPGPPGAPPLRPPDDDYHHPTSR